MINCQFPTPNQRGNDEAPAQIWAVLNWTLIRDWQLGLRNRRRWYGFQQ